MRRSLVIASVVLGVAALFCSCDEGGSDGPPNMAAKIVLDNPEAVFVSSVSTTKGVPGMKGDWDQLFQVLPDGTVAVVPFLDELGTEVEVVVNSVRHLGETYLHINFCLMFNDVIYDYYDVLCDTTDGILLDFSGWDIRISYLANGYIYVVDPWPPQGVIHRIDLTTRTATPMNNPAADPVAGAVFYRWISEPYAPAGQIINLEEYMCYPMPDGWVHVATPDGTKALDPAGGIPVASWMPGGNWAISNAIIRADNGNFFEVSTIGVKQTYRQEAPPLPGNGDADGDFLPDWFEDLYGFDKNDWDEDLDGKTDAYSDSDSDTWSNFDELVAGTDPTDAASVRATPLPPSGVMYTEIDYATGARTDATYVHESTWPTFYDYFIECGHDYLHRDQNRFMVYRDGYLVIAPDGTGGLDFTWTTKDMSFLPVELFNNTDAPVNKRTRGTSVFWLDAGTIKYADVVADTTVSDLVTPNNLLDWWMVGDAVLYTAYITGIDLGTYSIKPGQAAELIDTSEMEIRNIVEFTWPTPPTP